MIYTQLYITSDADVSTREETKEDYAKTAFEERLMHLVDHFRSNTESNSSIYGSEKQLDLYSEYNIRDDIKNKLLVGICERMNLFIINKINRSDSMRKQLI